MGVKIKIENCDIRDRAKVLNDGVFSDDAEIELVGTKFFGDAEVLNRLGVNEICTAVEKAKGSMGSAERESIRQVLSLKNGTKKTFLAALARHIYNFGEGVVTNLISSMISDRIGKI